MDWIQALTLAIIGAVAGLMGGLLGIGGAVIIIPALIYALGYTQTQAQGTTLLMLSLPVGAMAAWQYYQKGLVEVKASFMLAAFFFVGGLLGAKLALRLPQEILRKSFGILLMALAVKILFLDKK